ncbi:MAG: hypothetical protein SFU83_19525 [Meiothermus sp.]|nr:hypothetical protein [Meiothermus sp.]
MKYRYIYFDLDNTLFASTKAFKEDVARRLGVPVPDGDPATYYTGIQALFAPRQQEAEKAFQDSVRDPSVYLTMEPLPGAVEVVQQVAEAGRLAGFITHRPPEIANATVASIGRHFQVHAPLFLARNKASAMQLNSLLVEDHPDTAQDVADAGQGVLLFGDYGYNAKSNLPRIRDWSEFWPYLESLND